MRLHASCAALPGPDGYEAVLLVGPSGSGKSDLLLRLIEAGWSLVSDDQVVVEAGMAYPPSPLAGILEVRGLGLFRLPYVSARLRLVARLGGVAERLPVPMRDAILDLPVIALDAASASATARLRLALAAACDRLAQVAGAFAA